MLYIRLLCVTVIFIHLYSQIQIISRQENYMCMRQMGVRFIKYVFKSQYLRRVSLELFSLWIFQQGSNLNPNTSFLKHRVKLKSKICIKRKQTLAHSSFFLDNISSRFEFDFNFKDLATIKFSNKNLGYSYI